MSVLLRELTTLARRPLHWVIRAFFALHLALLIGCCCSYYLWADLKGSSETFFVSCMMMQLVMVALLAPGFVAGAIAEEKEYGTLESLLAADLSNREIILGKLTARIANISLLLLAPLSVLSIVQFFGGIDLNRLLVVFAATFLMMLSLSGVSMLCSILCRRVRDAVLLGYLIAIGYFVLSLIFARLSDEYQLRRHASTFAGEPISLEVAASVFGAGNPVIAVEELIRKGNSVLWLVLGKFALLRSSASALPES